MEVTRKNILTKVGIAPIETMQQIQKDIKMQRTETIGLGLLAAFEAGVIMTMGIMGKRQKTNTSYVSTVGTSSRYAEPAASEDFYDEEDMQ